MAASDESEPKDLLSPGEAATLFGVHPRTLSRWAKDGRLSSVITLGGHRRYHRSELEALAARHQ